MANVNEVFKDRCGGCMTLCCGLLCFSLPFWADINTLVVCNSVQLKNKKTWIVKTVFLLEELELTSHLLDSRVETAVDQLAQSGALQAQRALCGYWQAPQLLFHALPLCGSLWNISSFALADPFQDWCIGVSSGMAAAWGWLCDEPSKSVDLLFALHGKGRLSSKGKCVKSQLYF